MDGLAERQGPGRRLRIGDVLIELVKTIARDFGGRMALDSSVIQGGLVAVGDAVTLLG